MCPGPSGREHYPDRQPGLRGFTRANLFRMRQFYDAYRADTRVAPLVRQLPWSHNLVILSQAKRPEEREFYLRLAIAESWSRRELERQLKAALFERAVLTPAKVSPPVRQMNSAAAAVFKDSYVLEFLDLPRGHAEADLHCGLLLSLKDFPSELGRDFCFAGSEFPLQVGGRDFALHLLFFHRGLNCLEPHSLAGAGSRISDAAPRQETPPGKAARVLSPEGFGTRP